MPKISGGCLCGAVRYESSAEPSATSVCHCTHCQRVSGSAFSVNILVPRTSVTWSGTEPASYVDTAESGRSLSRKFCGKCGSSIASAPDAMPDVLVVKAGTLDDRSWLKPAVHIWTGSAQPWVQIDANTKTFPKGRT